MKKLEKKTVFITGGLSGIGKSCALAAASEGANIAVADIKSIDFDTAIPEIKAENEKTIFIDCDVTAVEQVRKAISTTIEIFGSLDIALNNAGVQGEPKRLEDISEEEWNHLLHVNLTSVFNCMKLELKEMSIRNKGVIINMSSVFGKVGGLNNASYIAAKHGILGLTRAAALENAAGGIRINAICPAYIHTPLLSKSGVAETEKAKQQIIDAHPMKRLGTADEVAKAFIFLASDDSSFMTGSTLEIDGGFLAR